MADLKIIEWLTSAGIPADKINKKLLTTIDNIEKVRGEDLNQIRDIVNAMVRVVNGEDPTPDLFPSGVKILDTSSTQNDIYEAATEGGLYRLSVSGRVTLLFCYSKTATTAHFGSMSAKDSVFEVLAQTADKGNGNAIKSAYTVMRSATPVGDNDVVTKKYFDDNNGGSFGDGKPTSDQAGAGYSKEESKPFRSFEDLERLSGITETETHITNEAKIGKWYLLKKGLVTEYPDKKVFVQYQGPETGIFSSSLLTGFVQVGTNTEPKIKPIKVLMDILPNELITSSIINTKTGTPTEAEDAASKYYVDTEIAKLPAGKEITFHSFNIDNFNPDNTNIDVDLSKVLNGKPSGWVPTAIVSVSGNNNNKDTDATFSLETDGNGITRGFIGFSGDNIRYNPFHLDANQNEIIFSGSPSYGSIEWISVTVRYERTTGGNQ